MPVLTRFAIRSQNSVRAGIPLSPPTLHALVQGNASPEYLAFPEHRFPKLPWIGYTSAERERCTMSADLLCMYGACTYVFVANLLYGSVDPV